jgi:hypothetical protein
MNKISSHVYLRKLNAQELGYRKGAPKKAGRYILISKEYAEYFPKLSETILNDYVMIYISAPHSEKAVMCHYVYHNSKIAERKSGGRDEFRIYLNACIDPNGDFFQPEDIIALLRQYLENEDRPNYLLFHFPTASKDSRYASTEALIEKSTSRGAHALVAVSNLPFLIKAGVEEVKSIIIPEEVKKGILDQPLFQEFEETEIVATTRRIRSASFRDLVLFFYDYKCALGGPVIRHSDLMNLQAAHIIPKEFRGGENPANGLCLCRDYHWAMDCGFFTVEDNYRVLVHPKALNIQNLSAKNGTDIILPQDKRMWPHPVALRFHRERVFGRFQRIS